MPGKRACANTAIDQEETTRRISALTRQVEQLRAEVALLRAEVLAARMDAGEEPLVPATVVHRIFVDGLSPIRAFRRWRGLNQQELAERIGSSKAYISQLETGRRKPGAGTLRKIARALDIPVEFLTE